MVAGLLRLLVAALSATAAVILLMAADLLLLAPVVFKLRLNYSLEPAWFVLPLLGTPRLMAGLCGGIALAFLTSRAGQVCALLGYGAFLLWIFSRYEAYVDWSDVLAIARAVVPYASGLIGMTLGIVLGSISSRYRALPV